MSADRIATVQKAMESVGGKVLTPIKLALGEDYSFGEIRYVIASMEKRGLMEPSPAFQLAS